LFIRRIFAILTIALLTSSICCLFPEVYAAPSGSISLDPSISTDNFLAEGENEEVIIIFKNTAEDSVDDVASTIQYLGVSVAVRNPSLISITLAASIEINDPTDTLRAGPFAVTGVKESSLFIPPGPPTTPAETVDIYTWKLDQPSPYTDNSQFTNALRVLRPGEYLYLTITVTCEGVGDSVSWFFFRATEDAFTSENYPTNINTISDKLNLYYSKLPGSDQTKYWLPLHNSYDPFDDDLSKGHAFEQKSWTRISTNTAYAKTNKIHHQSPKTNGGQPPKSVIHICGSKFLDLNRDGVYDMNTELGIDGFEITLLGPDPVTKAEEFYSGSLQISEAHGNPVISGEEGKALHGVYCFNLINVESGTYTFYIKIKESEGYTATTPTLIGPIIIEIDNDPAEESFIVQNNFGNMIFRPVGGKVVQVSRLNVILPYIVLGGLVVALSAFAIFMKKIRS